MKQIAVTKYTVILFIDLTTNEKTPFIETGDSLSLHVHHVDTVFQINKDNVVKKFKGYYFLNTLYEEGRWEVRKIQSVKNQIVISSISTENEIKTLQEITEAVSGNYYCTENGK